MTQTMKEMVETACETFFHIDGRGQEEWAEYCLRCPGLAEGDREDMRRALLAVLDKHVGPMLERAFEDGADEQRHSQQSLYPRRMSITGEPRAYAKFAIAAIRAALEE